MTRVQELEAACLRAKREYLLAEVKLLDEQLAAIGRPAAEADAARQQIDLTCFNPAWKKGGKGTNLSKEGVTAIMVAYEQFMPQSKVMHLFDISSTAAHNWHEKWKHRRQAA